MLIYQPVDLIGDIRSELRVGPVGSGPGGRVIDQRDQPERSVMPQSDLSHYWAETVSSLGIAVLVGRGGGPPDRGDVI